MKDYDIFLREHPINWNVLTYNCRWPGSGSSIDTEISWYSEMPSDYHKLSSLCGWHAKCITHRYTDNLHWCSLYLTAGWLAKASFTEPEVRLCSLYPAVGPFTTDSSGRNRAAGVGADGGSTHSVSEVPNVSLLYSVSQNRPHCYGPLGKGGSLSLGTSLGEKQVKFMFS